MGQSESVEGAARLKGALLQKGESRLREGPLQDEAFVASGDSVVTLAALTSATHMCLAQHLRENSFGIHGCPLLLVVVSSGVCLGK